MMATRHRRTSVGPVTVYVQETLSAAPCALPSDPDERSKLLRRKLQTRDPARIAEVVRDLAWHQRTGQASRQDVRLLWRADRRLARWLAAQTGEDRGWTRRKMWGTVERTVSDFV
jgi:RNA polymerase-interacting CarD/CdnL/TRCF family regulator